MFCASRSSFWLLDDVLCVEEFLLPGGHLCLHPLEPVFVLSLDPLGLLPSCDLTLQLFALLLLRQLLLLVLGLHLLDLYGIWLPPSHVEFVIAHAERENPLVDAEPGSKENKVGGLGVDGLDDKLA